MSWKRSKSDALALREKKQGKGIEVFGLQVENGGGAAGLGGEFRVIENAGEQTRGDEGTDAIGCDAVVFDVREVELLQLENGEIFVDANRVDDVEVAGVQRERRVRHWHCSR